MFGRTTGALLHDTLFLLSFDFIEWCNIKMFHLSKRKDPKYHHPNVVRYWWLAYSCCNHCLWVTFACLVAYEKYIAFLDVVVKPGESSQVTCGN